MKGTIFKCVFVIGVVLVIVYSLVIFQFGSSSAERPAAKPSITGTPDFDETIKLIIQNRDRGNFKEAVSLEEKYLKSDPKNVAVLIMLAEDYMRQDMFSQAEEKIKEAIKIDPNSGYGLRVSAEIPWNKSLRESDPKVINNYRSLAKLQIDKALTVAANDAWVNFYAAGIYSGLKEKNRAKLFVNKAIELEPKNKIFKELETQINSGL